MKKFLSLALTLCMLFSLFTCMPLSAFAVNQNQSNSVETQTTYANDTGMGKIINNLTDEKVENNSGYVISDLTVKDKTVTVKMNVLSDCTLVVAVYDENTLQMLGSGTKQVEFDENVPEYNSDVELEIDTMPRNFLSKAFLLDENNHALCKEFTCNTYTTMYQDFLNTTPDDFKDKEIVEMDENQDDFGVLNDGVVSTAFDEKMTYTYNAETGTYVFKNAIDEIKKLKVGDVFYYTLSEELGDFLLFKVKEIKVNASTVTIVEDEDISLADAFQFLRIDEDADFNEVDVDENELGSALEIDDSQPQKSQKQKAELDKNMTETFSTSLNLSYPQKESDDKNAWNKGWKISGKIGYTLQASVKLYYDVRLGKDFYEFKTELNHTVDFKISVAGTIGLNKDKACIPIGGSNGIPIGVFNLYIKVYPIIEFSGNVDLFSFKIFSSNSASISGSDGLTKDNTLTKVFSDPKMGQTKITIKAGIGVEAEFGWKKGKKDLDGLQKLVATVSINMSAYFRADLTPSFVGAMLDKFHDCIFCLDGDLNAVIEGTLSIKLKLISDKLSWSWDAISLGKSWLIGEMYLSVNPNSIKIGMGGCPNLYHKMTVIVKDSSGKAIEKATVTAKTGRCDADGDGKYNDESTKTDKNGIAEFYFNKGKHEATVETDHYEKQRTFSMSENEKEIVFTFSDGVDLTGDYIYWGKYPQNEVTDGALLWALNNKAKSKENEWKSYGYYSGNGKDGSMKPGDWMQYLDMEYDGEKYRAVKFSKYRPEYTTRFASTNKAEESSYFVDAEHIRYPNRSKMNSIYFIDTVYWFKFQKIKWKILDSREGVVLSDKILDSQPYCNTIYSYGLDPYRKTGKWNNEEHTNLANDYYTSSIRKWLNEDFYNTAFNNEEMEKIDTTNLDNSAYSNNVSKYNGRPSEDKIYLLSYSDTKKYKIRSDLHLSGDGYNLIVDHIEHGGRAKGTLYALSQGLVDDNYSPWLLRTPSDESSTVRVVTRCGCVNRATYTAVTSCGIRPAFRFNLDSDTDKKVIKKRLSNTKRNLSPLEIFNFDFAVPGEEYIMLAVKDKTAENLVNPENLMYIDQKTAETNKVEFTYIPKDASSEYEVIILGKCSHSYESEITKEPTCNEEGEKTVKCSVCGDTYAETITATGHKEETIKGIPATCTKDGLADGTRCSVCGETIKSQEVIKATGHKEETIKGTPATCTKDGLTDGTKCSVCSEIVKAQEVIKATGNHTYSAWKVTKPVTCTATGTQIRTCSVCGKTETQTIAKTAHKVVTDKAVAATCTKNGKTAGSHCSVCGTVIKAQTTMKAKGHTYGKWSVTKQPTYTATGIQTRICTACGAKQTATVVKRATTSITKCAITMAKSAVYTGKALAPKVTVKNGKTTLKSGTHYTVAYKNNTKVGKATVTIKGVAKNGYSGSKTLTFNIVPANVKNLKATQTSTSVKLTWSKVSGATGYRVFRHDGKKWVKLTDTKNTTYTVSKLKAGVNYKYAVRAYATVGKTPYWSASYPIITTATKPATPTIKVTAGKKQATVSWNKVSGASGYVVYYSTSKNGTYKKLATAKGTSYTAKKLTTGRTYYFKVAAYKTVGGKNVYGACSSIKSIKVK